MSGALDLDLGSQGRNPLRCTEYSITTRKDDDWLNAPV